MEIGSRAPGRMPAARISPSHAIAVGFLALLLTVALGCGTQSGEPSAGTEGQARSQPTADAGAERSAKRSQAVSASHDAAPGRRTSRIRLTAKGCVQFEPHWSTLHAGQSLTWQSELKSSVTIHVSPGAFDKTEYVVRPGATVTTGPARDAGSFLIWTEPTACQGVSRGVQGSGPGVTVEGSASGQ